MSEWYVIRVTHGRTQGVYDRVLALHREDLNLYYPCLAQKQFSLAEGEVRPSDRRPVPLLPGFLFVQTTEAGFCHLLDEQIPGLTPYYNHFRERTDGRNPYLTIPERQMENFQRYCDAQDDHKLYNQADVPAFLNGKKVRITSGPFVGVEGVLLRWKQMRRVFIDLGELGRFGTGFIRTCDFELCLE